MAGYIAVWEFQVRPEQAAEFEHYYDTDGEWEKLFRRAPGYMETRLLKDRGTPGRYVTVDRWHSEQSFRAFREQFAVAYDELDRRCEAFTLGERVVGAFGGSTNLIETERLSLRKFDVGDAEFIFELVNDASFLRFIGDKAVRSLEDAREYIRKGPLESYARFGFGMYLVRLKRDGTPIGMCGLVKRESLQDVDVGFALLPRFHSHGYAFESAAAVVAYAKHSLGLTRLAGITKPDNFASIRVLEKLGLRAEGTVKIGEEGPENMLFAREI